MAIGLNSVLLDGFLVNWKPKRNSSGAWVLLRCDGRKPGIQGRTTFRIDVPTILQQRLKEPLSHGSRLRIVGRLENASRIGAFVRADLVEALPMEITD